MARFETDFQTRVERIESDYRLRMSNGIVQRVQHDGLIVARPRKRTPRFPFRGILTMAAGLLGFKVLLVVWLGPNIYNERVDMLRAGTVVERGGAYVMQVDPVTVWLSAGVNTMIRKLSN